MKNAYIYIVSTVLAVFAFSGKAIAATDGDPDYTKITASKTVKSVDKDGTVTLRLETFVQGDSSNVSKVKALDVVFVLDKSGSMLFPVSGAIDKVGSTDGLDTSKSYYLYYNYYGTINMYLMQYRNNKWQYKNNNGNWKDLPSYQTTVSESSNYWWVVASNDDPKTRISALKDACDLFVDKIKANAAETGAHHKVGYVAFSSDASTTYSLSESYDNVKSSIRNLSAGGGTQTGDAMQKVYTNFFKSASDARNQVVVLFTDGAPGGTAQTPFSTTEANDAIAASRILKAPETQTISGQKGKKSTVYSVGIFSTETDNIRKFMNYTSSNYKDAQSMTTPGSATSTEYYYKALTPQDLTDIFKKIVDSELDKTGGTGCPLETEKVTLKDIVTPSFVVPEGESTVTLKMVNAVLDSNKEVTWSSEEVDAKWTDKDGVERRATVKSTANNTIDVVGFDFNKLWYGLVRKYNGEAKPENEVKSERVAHGAKLIIEIKIKPNPDAEGGYQSTNSDKSGVYVDGVLTPVRYYDVPAPVFVSTLELEIQNTSLKENESAIYTVTRKDSKGVIDPDYSVEAIVSAYKEGNSAALVNSVKLKVEARDPYSEPYTYIVTPNNDWDWTYKDTSAISSKLYTVASDGTITVIEENPFVFSNASETVNALHDEHFNKNVFSK